MNQNFSDLTAPRSISEHSEIVYGLDRSMVEYLGRVIRNIGTGRHTAMKKAGYSSPLMDHFTKEEIDLSWSAYLKGCDDLLKEVHSISLITRSNVFSERVSLYWTQFCCKIPM